MYKVGDRIVYGNSGVCEVSEIRTSPFGNGTDDRLFYVLEPVNDTTAMTIYTPVDCDNVVIRDLVTKKEALALLKSIPDIDPLEIPVEKERRELYRVTVKTTDLVDYVRVIKTVSERRRVFKKSRRRLPDLDNDFEHTARNCLYGELAAVLGVDRDEIHRRVCKLLEPAEEAK